MRTELKIPFLVASMAVGSHLSADGAVAAIADGQAWQLELESGASATRLLDPDGTGQIKLGFLRKSVTWSGKGDDLCVQGTPRGDRCATWHATDNGFVAIDAQGMEIALSR